MKNRRDFTQKTEDTVQNIYSMKKDCAEAKVSDFYNTLGWQTEGDITEDAKRWEDLRNSAKRYVTDCRLRVLRQIPASGSNMLDMASGPIQYPEYLEYSKNFSKRYCVDLSSQALENAEKKIGDHGVFLCGSFFDIPFENNFFDCTVSLHTIYHINKERQEEAVRKMLRLTKPGKPVIVVYSNANLLINKFRLPARIWKKVKKRFTVRKTTEKESVAYSFQHPLDWWNRFEDVADITFLPWRSFSAEHQKMLFPDNRIGLKLFEILFKLEEKFPSWFVKWFQYPMIILTKRVAS